MSIRGIREFYKNNVRSPDVLDPLVFVYFWMQDYYHHLLLLPVYCSYAL